VSFKLDTPSRRIAFAIGISVLLHGLVLWGPNIQLPRFKSSRPAITARLEPLPAAPARPKQKRKAKSFKQKALPKPVPHADAPKQDPVPAPKTPDNAPVGTGTPAPATNNYSERPPLPKHAQLTFDINKGTSHFRVGETIHTLDINDGRYVLTSRTTTVGVAKLFKSYELNQYSNGSYDKYGLQPELFTEERIDRIGTQRNAVEFDYAEQRAHFSNGVEAAFAPGTQDILSIMYQFPPLRGVEITPVSVSNGRKIEQYEFEIATNLEIDTPLGKLLTVRLRKMHAPDEEGLEIWLAQEYRLFPVKIRFIEKNGEITGEAVISDIRVSEEPGVKKDAAN
jgi:Protein of unknown function (DUF3108)